MTTSVAAIASASVNIRPYEQDVERAWDDYVFQHSQGSLFHLTAWKRVIEKVFGYESRYLVAQKNGLIRGVLPLFFVRNIIHGRSLISIPFGMYGGICASDDEAIDALCSAASEMARAEKVQYLELRQQLPTGYQGFKEKKLYVTFNLELPTDPDELLQHFPRDTRYMIRKGKKNGLRAIVDNQQLTTFYDIYAHSVHHLGTPVFPQTFFQTLVDEFGDQSELTTIWHGDKAVAGVLSFRYRDWILPLYGGSLLESRNLAANNFMYWKVMRRSIENGIRFFDFGRSKLGTGAYLFKRQWNMREQALPYQLYLVKSKTMPNHSPSNPRFHLAISLWKALPFALTQKLGPLLVGLFP
jgi:FemAB-related protein (PEP-CTERM system-associated)